MHSHAPNQPSVQSHQQQPCPVDSDPIEDQRSLTKTAEIYGTLPKKGSRPRSHYSNIGNQPSVYQTFIDKQRAAGSVPENNDQNPATNMRQSSNSSSRMTNQEIKQVLLNDYVSRKQLDELKQHRERCDSESSVMAVGEESSHASVGSTNGATNGRTYIQREHSADSIYSQYSHRSSTSSSASASTSSTLDGHKGVNSDTYTKHNRPLHAPEYGKVNGYVFIHIWDSYYVIIEIINLSY